MVNKIINYRNIFLLCLIIILFGLVNTTNGSDFPLKIGDKVQIKTKNINTNLVNGFKSNTLQGYVAGYDGKIIYLNTKGDIRIDKVVKKDGSIVGYPFIGARYNGDSKSVIGRDKNGDIITIDLKEIDYIESTLFVKDKNMRTKIENNTIHYRLRNVNSYPELIYEIQTDSISKIERWKKGSTSTVALGALLGGAFGYLYGSQVEEDDEPTPEWFDAEYSRDTKIAFDVVAGVLAGGTIGYLIGKSRWQKVSVNKLNISLKSNASSGTGLKFAIKF